MEPTLIKTAFQEGLRDKSYASRNGLGLTECLNMKPTAEGLVAWDRDLTALNGTLQTNLIAAGLLDVNGYAVWPKTQIYRGRDFTLAMGSTSVYEVDESTNGVSAITVYDYASQATSTIDTGGPWQVADFGPVLFLFNGACTLIRVAKWFGGTLGAYKWYVDKTAIPSTGANVRGRLMLGGFNAVGTTHGSIMSGLYALAKSDLGMDASYPALSQYGPKSVWWSSISAEDMFQFFFPDMLFAMPDILQTNSINNSNGGFSTGSGWTLVGAGVSIGFGTLNFAAAATGTATQASGSQALAIEVGKPYRVRYTISAMSAGSVKAMLGTASGVSRTAAGSYSEVIFCTGTTDIVVSGTACTCTIDNLAVYEMDTMLAEELFLRNEQGSKTTPWIGNVLRVAPLGDGCVVYTDDGVGLFLPTPSTFGFQKLIEVGCLSRSSWAGDKDTHWYMDKTGCFWRIGSDYKPVRLGFEEFGASMLSGTTIGTFDPQRREAYFGNASSTPTGIGFSETGAAFRTGKAIASLHRKSGLTYRTWVGGGNESLSVTTDILDFGGREVGTIGSYEVAYSGTTLASTIYRRMSPEDSFATVSMGSVGRRGMVARAVSGTEFKVNLSATAYSSVTKIDYLKLYYRPGGKKSLRDLV